MSHYTLLSTLRPPSCYLDALNTGLWTLTDKWVFMLEFMLSFGISVSAQANKNTFWEKGYLIFVICKVNNFLVLVIYKSIQIVFMEVPPPACNLRFCSDSFFKLRWLAALFFFHSQCAVQSEGTWQHCIVALIGSTWPFHCLNDVSFSWLWLSLRLRIYPPLFLVAQMSFPSHISSSGGLEVTGWGTWAEIRLCFQTPPLLVGNASLDSGLGFSLNLLLFRIYIPWAVTL